MFCTERTQAFVPSMAASVVCMAGGCEQGAVSYAGLFGETGQIYAQMGYYHIFPGIR